MAVSREKLARSVGVISDQQELVNEKKLAKPVLRKSRPAKICRTTDGSCKATD